MNSWGILKQFRIRYAKHSAVINPITFTSGAKNSPISPFSQASELLYELSCELSWELLCGGGAKRRGINNRRRGEEGVKNGENEDSRTLEPVFMAGCMTHIFFAWAAFHRPAGSTDVIYIYWTFTSGFSARACSRPQAAVSARVTNVLIFHRCTCQPAISVPSILGTGSPVPVRK